MKTTLPTTLVLTAAALLVGATASAGNNTNAVVIPLSSFTDDATKGKDPFFPESMRRTAVIAQAAPAWRRLWIVCTVLWRFSFRSGIFSRTRSANWLYRLWLVHAGTIVIGTINIGW